MRRPKASGYITLRQVAALLGDEWSVATKFRMLRAFKAREALLGRRLMWRNAEGAGRTFHTTLAIVREAFPEWFDRRDEMAVLLAEQLEDYEAERKRLSDRVDALAKLLASHVSCDGA